MLCEASARVQHFGPAWEFLLRHFFFFFSLLFSVLTGHGITWLSNSECSAPARPAGGS